MYLKGCQIKIVPVTLNIGRLSNDFLQISNYYEFTQNLMGILGGCLMDSIFTRINIISRVKLNLIFKLQDSHTFSLQNSFYLAMCLIIYICYSMLWIALGITSIYAKNRMCLLYIRHMSENKFLSTKQDYYFCRMITRA